MGTIKDLNIISDILENEELEFSIKSEHVDKTRLGEILFDYDNRRGYLPGIFIEFKLPYNDNHLINHLLGVLHSESFRKRETIKRMNSENTIIKRIQKMTGLRLALFKFHNESDDSDDLDEPFDRLSLILLK